MFAQFVFVLKIKLKQAFTCGPHEISVLIELTLGHAKTMWNWKRFPRPSTLQVPVTVDVLDFVTELERSHGYRNGGEKRWSNKGFDKSKDCNHKSVCFEAKPKMSKLSHKQFCYHWKYNHSVVTRKLQDAPRKIKKYRVKGRIYYRLKGRTHQRKSASEASNPVKK